jgi:NADP-dependent 3-hydroxy acid dehydrogenase YdfG
MDLRDHVVVIAGATGCVGGAFAKLVLARGGKVAAAVRRPWQVAKLHEVLGRERLLAGVVPPLDTEAAAGFAKGANDALGPITAFVGAAGRLQARSPGHEPGGDLPESLEANVHANATLARAVLPFLRRRRSGTLTFAGASARSLAEASIASRIGKAALHELVLALAAELQGTGVRASAVLLDHGGDAMHERALDALATAAFGVPRGGPLFPLDG